MHGFESNPNLRIENRAQQTVLAGFRPRSGVSTDRVYEQHIGQSVNDQFRPRRRNRHFGSKHIQGCMERQALRLIGLYKHERRKQACQGFHARRAESEPSRNDRGRSSSATISITWLPFFGATSHKPRVRVRGLSRSVVDPGGGIREDQFCLVLRGGGFFNPGIVPPRDAKRPELSRSMRALRASRIKAVFSATPGYRWARRTRA